MTQQVTSSTEMES